MSAPRRHPALDAWGEYDRDDPFPLFAQVRVAGPVHEARLADGHAAWRVVGHEEARAALADPRLSKDMHAAQARSEEIVADGLPGPALARHMLVVDPPDHTRLRRRPRPPSASSGSPRWRAGLPDGKGGEPLVARTRSKRDVRRRSPDAGLHRR